MSFLGGIEWKMVKQAPNVSLCYSFFFRQRASDYAHITFTIASTRKHQMHHKARSDFSFSIWGTRTVPYCMNTRIIQEISVPFGLQQGATLAVRADGLQAALSLLLPLKVSILSLPTNSAIKLRKQKQTDGNKTGRKHDFGPSAASAFTQSCAAFLFA